MNNMNFISAMWFAFVSMLFSSQFDPQLGYGERIFCRYLLGVCVFMALGALVK